MPDIDKSKITLGVAAGLFLFLLAQAVTAVWWASNISANMTFLRESLSVATSDRYPATEARRDLEARDNKIKDVSDNVRAISQIIGEGKLERKTNEQKFQSAIDALQASNTRLQNDLDRLRKP